MKDTSDCTCKGRKGLSFLEEEIGVCVISSTLQNRVDTEIVSEFSFIPKGHLRAEKWEIWEMIAKLNFAG